MCYMLKFFLYFVFLMLLRCNKWWWWWWYILPFSMRQVSSKLDFQRDTRKCQKDHYDIDMNPMDFPPTIICSLNMATNINEMKIQKSEPRMQMSDKTVFHNCTVPVNNAVSLVWLHTHQSTQMSHYASTITWHKSHFSVIQSFNRISRHDSI